jgi:hypothetical protein
MGRRREGEEPPWVQGRQGRGNTAGELQGGALDTPSSRSRVTVKPPEVGVPFAPTQFGDRIGGSSSGTSEWRKAMQADTPGRRARSRALETKNKALEAKVKALEAKAQAKEAKDKKRADRDRLVKEAREKAVSRLMAVPDEDFFRLANKFVHGRAEQLEKDMAICLRQTCQMNRRKDKPFLEKRVASFPSLMCCISFLELFSGLYAGRLKGIGLKGIKSYAKKFLKDSVYKDDELAILYEAFRHKVAHVTQPYGVFDTETAGWDSGLRERERRRITWEVIDTEPELPAIIIKEETGKKEKGDQGSVWEVPWDHLCTIGIHNLFGDIVASATGRKGYLQHLHEDPSARKKFANCIVQFFPPGPEEAEDASAST